MSKKKLKLLSKNCLNLTQKMNAIIKKNKYWSHKRHFICILLFHRLGRRFCFERISFSYSWMEFSVLTTQGMTCYLILTSSSSIYILCLSVCLFVCLYPINVKTTEPIGPKFCVGPHVTPGKVYEWSKSKNLCIQVFYSCKILKCAKKYYEIRKKNLFGLYKKKMGAKPPQSLVFLIV